MNFRFHYKQAKTMQPAKVDSLFQVIYGKKPIRVKQDSNGNFEVVFLKKVQPRNRVIYAVVKVSRQQCIKFGDMIVKEHQHYLESLENYHKQLRRTGMSRWLLTPPTEKERIIIQLIGTLKFKKGEKVSLDRYADKILALKQRLFTDKIAEKLIKNRDGWMLYLLKRLTLIPYLLNITEISRTEGTKVMSTIKIMSKPKRRI